VDVGIIGQQLLERGHTTVVACSDVVIRIFPAGYARSSPSEASSVPMPMPSGYLFMD
jgi:hypothetical protein